MLVLLLVMVRDGTLKILESIISQVAYQEIQKQLYLVEPLTYVVIQNLYSKDTLIGHSIRTNTLCYIRKQVLET